MATNSDLRTVGLGFCWQDYEVGDRFQTIGRTVTEADLVNFINTTGMTEVVASATFLPTIFFPKPRTFLP